MPATIPFFANPHVPFCSYGSRSNQGYCEELTGGELRATIPGKMKHVDNTRKTAVIIGAGPAGLTAAYELVHKTDIKPVILELSDMVGGISRTENYKGNRIDIGGHRFFSKSRRVMDWWTNILPIQEEAPQGSKALSRDDDRVMLTRKRVSRIFAFRKLFKYPISLNIRTVRNLGLRRSCRIFISYVYARVFPIKPEASLRDFLINRFGVELYLTFFKSYTEKVWGMPCRRIGAKWGKQRIKGLSLSRAVWDYLRKLFRKNGDIKQGGIETSLIEMFLYPKYGPGQLWEEVARIIQDKGVEIHFKHHAVGIQLEGNQVCSVQVQNKDNREIKSYPVDYLLSSMPVKDLVCSMGKTPPAQVRTVVEGLMYRDFITVGVLLKKVQIRDDGPSAGRPTGFPRDNWIYIQEDHVKAGRLQILNNWSPYLVQDPSTVWLGMEYFCSDGDDLSRMPDKAFKSFAIEELCSMGMAAKEDVLDSTIIRVPKAYPAYFGSYDQFDAIQRFTDSIENLFLIGRNGMHQYNNQDHSMLAAMVSVDNILADVKSKGNIWAVNAEEEYHEKKII